MWCSKERRNDENGVPRRRFSAVGEEAGSAAAATAEKKRDARVLSGSFVNNFVIAFAKRVPVL
jgi:hypothetical protein